MAHFAQVSSGVVTNVIVVSNENCGGGVFPDSEPIGQAFIASLGIAGEWKQTSYNTYLDENGVSRHAFGGKPFRGTYAGIGYAFDEVNDVFVPPFNYEPEDDAVNDVFVAPTVEEEPE